MNRLKEKYTKKIIPLLQKELKLKNSMTVPKLTKIVINIGLKEGAGDKGVVAKVAKYLELIAGQKIIITKARKAEAAFKTRKGDPIGAMVTLRGERMYDFMDKLVSIVLPRVRDFQGVSRTSFDGQGNYSIGFQEQIVFHEVDYDTIDNVRGLQVTLVTTATDNQSAFKLLEALGLPFAKEEEK